MVLSLLALTVLPVRTDFLLQLVHLTAPTQQSAFTMTKHLRFQASCRVIKHFLLFDVCCLELTMAVAQRAQLFDERCQLALPLLRYHKHVKPTSKKRCVGDRP